VLTLVAIKKLTLLVIIILYYNVVLDMVYRRRKLTSLQPRSRGAKYFRNVPSNPNGPYFYHKTYSCGNSTMLIIVAASRIPQPRLTPRPTFRSTRRTKYYDGRRRRGVSVVPTGVSHTHIIILLLYSTRNNIVVTNHIMWGARAHLTVRTE